MKKRVVIICCIVALGLAIGCNRNHPKQLKFSGTLEMTEHQLGAKAPGGIVFLSVQEGDFVKAGQIIATLDRFEQTKKDYERARALFKQGGVNSQSVEYAFLNMQDQQIISPIDGVVLVKVRQVGEVVAPGSPVIVIGDPKDRWVKIFISEGEINKIKMRQKATVSFDGIKDTYQGTVRFIATKAEFTPRNVQTSEERVTQNFAVKIAIDDVDMPAHAGVAADVRLD